MNKDLEVTVQELGPGYAELVGRLRQAYAPMEAPEVRLGIRRLKGALREGGLSSRKVAFLVAASVMLVLALAAVFLPAPGTLMKGPLPANVYTVACMPQHALDEIIRTQNNDGSWQSDYITRQNAAALKAVAAESVAYRKAVRYLRSKGLEPLSDAELQSRTDAAYALHRRS